MCLYAHVSPNLHLIRASIFLQFGNMPISTRTSLLAGSFLELCTKYLVRFS